VHTTVMSRTFFLSIFFGSSHYCGLSEINCGKHHLTEAITSLFTNDKKPWRLQTEVGALRILWLAFKLLGYKLCSALDVGTGSLLRLHDGPLHHWLKGDLGVPALKACQHILHHNLC
jgi:hypothetical protein